MTTGRPVAAARSARARRALAAVTLYVVSTTASSPAAATARAAASADGPVPGEVADGIDGPEGVFVLPGTVSAFEGHHERHAGVGQFSAEGVVVAIGAVGDDRPEHHAGRLR